MKASSDTAPLRVLVVDLVLAVYLYLFLEWLFFATKPSFMAVMPWTQKLSLALVAALPVLALFLALLLPLYLASRLNVPFVHRLPWLAHALVYAVLALLLVDNFTYTMFGIGVINTSGISALAYLLLWTVLFVWIWWRISTAGGAKGDTGPAWRRVTAVLLPLVGISIATGMAVFGSTVSDDDNGGATTRPNILFFAADGIDADLLTAFGGEYDATPELDEFLSESMVFDAALPNAARTTGSTVSMLSGKYPATTRVLFPPHTLTGADAFEHLPGILRRDGYRLFQETIRYYADGPDLNMRQGFHVANRRAVASAMPDWVPESFARQYSSPLLLLERVSERVSERFLHLSGVRRIRDVYAAVNDDPAKVYGFKDRGRIDETIRFISSEPGPLFMHVHLMDTHCCKFRPPERVYSAGFEEQTRDNEKQYLADAVRYSDRLFGELMDALAAAGKLENTLIVYSSDHGMRWRANRRMPLLIRFPGGKHAGRIGQTVQLLDVAPTLLDHLGLAIPPWMEGQSLISDDVDPQRPMFSVAGVEREVFETDRDKVSRLVGSGPPFYGMKTMTVSVCDRWYSLALDSGRVRSGKIPRHPGGCPAGSEKTLAEARDMIDQHLSQRGFILPREEWVSL